MLAEARRRELLGALGVDLYVPRATPAPERVAALVVFCTEADAQTPGARHLRQALPNALGIEAAQVVWVSQKETVPPPAAWLVLGPGGANDAELSTMLQNGAVIAVAEKPDVCLSTPGAKRALWQALKPVARYLRGGGG